jgi:Fe-S-cluster containining protein
MSDFLSLTPDETFRFSCHPGIACFNQCCRDLNHALTPYDILRLKNRLEVSSGEFLQRYTLRHTGPASGLPIVTINMTEREDLQCPFVSKQGCSVYLHRPGFCRIYPLGRIVRKKPNQSVCEESFMLIREPHCLGHFESKTWTVKDWKEDQGVQLYNEMNDLLMEIISLKNRSGKKELSAEEKELFCLACYDLDRFRDFAVGRKLWEVCRAQEAPSGRSEEDDAALLRFALAWVRDRLFGAERAPENNDEP